MSTEQLAGLKYLRMPFDDNQVSKLPKPLLRREEMDKIPKEKCKICNGYHAKDKVMHLDYVGHAALTDRLLDADPLWSWEPLAFDNDGLPKLDKDGGLWIRLTVCGMTRLGYGDADGKTGGNAVKERIGDALRNAAMRFGAALDLWHKGDLHKAADPNEWTDADKEEARQSVYSFADELLTMGATEQEQAEIIAKPLSTIGDTSITFDKWNNRFVGFAERASAKFKKV